MIERGVFFLMHRYDFASRGQDVARALRKHDLAGARAKVKDSDLSEDRVVAAGLAEAERGPDAVAEAMLSQKAQEKLRLERNLAILGTLGNNTPFIGLFGTVLGIIKASHDLTASQAGGGAAATAVMAGVFEALVATAVGLLVAIPAVVGYNYFQRRVRATVGNIDSLAHLVLAQLRGEESGAANKDKKLTEVK
jgi:biopolymer transport protein ExbB